MPSPCLVVHIVYPPWRCNWANIDLMSVACVQVCWKGCPGIYGSPVRSGAWELGVGKGGRLYLVCSPRRLATNFTGLTNTVNGVKSEGMLSLVSQATHKQEGTWLKFSLWMMLCLCFAMRFTADVFCLLVLQRVRKSHLLPDGWTCNFQTTSMVHLCNALINLNARRYTLSDDMYLRAIEQLITVAMAKIKSRFNEVDFYLSYSVA